MAKCMDRETMFIDLIESCINTMDSFTFNSPTQRPTSPAMDIYDDGLPNPAPTPYPTEEPAPAPSSAPSPSPCKNLSESQPAPSPEPAADSRVPSVPSAVYAVPPTDSPLDVDSNI